MIADNYWYKHNFNGGGHINNDNDRANIGILTTVFHCERPPSALCAFSQRRSGWSVWCCQVNWYS